MLPRPDFGDALPDDLIESKQAAILAKCNIRAIWRWVLAGKIRGWRRFGRTFVSREDVLASFEQVIPTKDLPPSTIPTRRDLTRRDKWVQSELKRLGLTSGGPPR